MLVAQGLAVLVPLAASVGYTGLTEEQCDYRYSKIDIYLYRCIYWIILKE